MQKALDDKESEGFGKDAAVFTPQGKLKQVEFAKAAAGLGSTAIGIVVNDGKDVVLICEKNDIGSKWAVSGSVKKITQIDEHIMASASGILSDSGHLMDKMIVLAQDHRSLRNEPVKPNKLAKEICAYMQPFTQFSGMRPFGVSLLVAGVVQGSAGLFEIDPSGTFLEWLAIAIGKKKDKARELLETRYSPDMNINESILLGINILVDSSESHPPSYFEVGVVESSTGIYRIIGEKELKKYIMALKP